MCSSSDLKIPRLVFWVKNDSLINLSLCCVITECHNLDWVQHAELNETQFFPYRPFWGFILQTHLVCVIKISKNANNY